MASIGNCPSCGGINDLLMTTCGWCKNSLMQDQIMLDKLSDQEIILKATEYTELAGGRNFSGKRAPEKPGSTLESKIFWTKEEVIGIAEKNLVLLKIRGVNNPMLAEMYKETKSNLEKTKRN